MIESNNLLPCPFLTSIEGSNNEFLKKSHCEALTDRLLAPVRSVCAANSIVVSANGVEVKTHSIALRVLALLAVILLSPIILPAFLIGSLIYGCNQRIQERQGHQTTHAMRYHAAQKQIQKRLLANTQKLVIQPDPVSSLKTEPVAFQDVMQLQTNLVDFPEKLLESMPGSTQRLRMKGYPDLFECSCIGTRHNIPNRRQQMEDTVIKNIQDQFPVSTRKSITICSIASGGCFQELVLHAKLAKLGYIINWILVDPKYYEQGDRPENHPTLKQFTSLVSEISPGSTSLSYRDYESYFAQNNGLKPDVFLAIDVDINGFIEMDKKLLESDPNFVAQLPPKAAHEKTIYVPCLGQIQFLVRQQAQSRLLITLNRLGARVEGRLRYFEENHQNPTSEIAI